MYESLQLLFVGILVTSLVTLLVKVRKHPQRERLWERFWNDVRLLKKNFILLVCAVIMITYVQGVIGRTLAYYLHHRMEEYVALKENETITLQSARLYDLGHALMPDRSASTAIRVINEALQYTMFLALAGVFAVPYWLPLLTDGRRDAKVYTVDMVTRFLVSLAIGHFLRMCCYLVTSLPGPAQHCIVDMNNKPKTVMDILTSPRVGGNCGDLIFSGHMLTVVTIFSIIQLYVECIFSRRTSLLVLLALSPLAFWQVLNILLLRAHYTVDMVVAVEVALFLNLTLHRLWWVSDHAVCEEGSVSGTPSDTNSESVIIHFDEEVVDEGRPVSESALPKVLVITSPDSNSESLSGQGETLECSQNDE